MGLERNSDFRVSGVPVYSTDKNVLRSANMDGGTDINKNLNL